MACNSCAVADVVAVPDVPRVPADAVEQVELFLSCERCDDRGYFLFYIIDGARHCGQKEQHICWSHFTSLAPLRMWSSVPSSKVMTNVDSEKFKIP